MGIELLHTILLTDEEMDELANCADSYMEDWLSLRDAHKTGSKAWKQADVIATMWTSLAMKLGCRYEDMAAASEEVET